MITPAPAPLRTSAGCDVPDPRLCVLVVSPIRFFADALVAELSRYPQMDVHVWLGADPPERPDVVLVEERQGHGLAALRHCRGRFPGIPIVALGIDERTDQVVACIEAGAAGYVASGAELPELVSAIERASRGEAICPPAVAGALFRRVAGLASQAAVDPIDPALLTPREQEIASMMGGGFSNKAIARELGIRVPTVKCHVHQVLRKLGATSRTSLMTRSRRRPAHESRPTAAP